MINHKIVVNSAVQMGLSTSLDADTTIGIIGTAELGSDNELILVNSFDLSNFGDPATGTLVPNIRILQRYGIKNIVAVKVSGIDAPTTTTNIVGDLATRTGVYKFLDSPSTLQLSPEIILIPGESTDPVVVAGLAVASTLRGMLALDFPLGTSFANIATARGTSTALGTKNARLVVTAPHVLNGAVAEPLSTHFAGVVGRTSKDLGYGYTASNKALKNVETWESGFSLSYTDEDAENQKLEALGVVSINQNSEGLVLWGNRNALYEDGGMELEDTYIVAQRVRQKLDNAFLETSQKFLDKPATESYGRLLEKALKGDIVREYNHANLSRGSTAKYVYSEDDLAQRTFSYNICLIINLPVELITLNLEYLVSL